MRVNKLEKLVLPSCDSGVRVEKVLQQAEKNKDSATQKKSQGVEEKEIENLQTMMMRSSADYRNQSKSAWKGPPRR